jgi:hypothetical protein
VVPPIRPANLIEVKYELLVQHPVVPELIGVLPPNLLVAVDSRDRDTYDRPPRDPENTPPSEMTKAKDQKEIWVQDGIIAVSPAVEILLAEWQDIVGHGHPDSETYGGMDPHCLPDDLQTRFSQDYRMNERRDLLEVWERIQVVHGWIIVWYTEEFLPEFRLHRWFHRESM